MKEIPLTKGTVALVDDADYEYLSQFKWCNQNGYAKRRVTIANRHITHNMQSYIMVNAAPSFIVDHIDGNPLNNQRSNLRLCTQQQNMCNTKRLAGKSGYRGVNYYDKCKNKPPCWIARIRFNGKHKHLGYFEDAEIAAKVYDAAAKELHGEFAVLNFAS